MQGRSVVWVCEHAAIVADEVVGLAVIEDEEVEVDAEDEGYGEEGAETPEDRSNSPLSVEAKLCVGVVDVKVGEEFSPACTL